MSKYLEPRVLVPFYAVLMPIAWPTLPGNVRISDILFPVIAFQVLRGHREHRPWRALDYCVAAYVLSAVPSMFVSDSVAASGLAFAKRLYLACAYLVFSIYFTRDGFERTIQALIRTAAGLSVLGVAAVFAYSAVGVEMPWLGSPQALPYFGTVLRVRGATDGPEMFGNYLTLVIPFVLLAGVAGLERGRRQVIEIALIVVAMILTFGHAGAGFGVAAVAALWPLLRGRSWFPVRAALAAAAVLIVVVVNAMLIFAIRRVDVTTGTDASVSVPAYVQAIQDADGAERLTLDVAYNPMGYFLLKKVALAAFMEQPVTGIGLGRFHSATEQAYRDGRLNERFRAIDPHSTPFGALAESGLPGLAAVAALFGVVLLHPGGDASLPARRWIAVASWAAVLGLAVNSLNVDVMNFRFLWVVLAAQRSAA
jgi:hypothetical protein